MKKNAKEIVSYRQKIPVLPYKKDERKKPHKCRPDKPGNDETLKRPRPFKGHKERLKHPEKQNLPFLTIHIDFLGQWETIKEGGDVLVSVTNNGNSVAYTPIVELIESAYNGLFVDPPNPTQFERRGSSMLRPLYPGQTITTRIKWSRRRPQGRIVGICYDPLLDPRPSIPYRPWNLPDFHKKITSIHWSSI